MDSVLMDTWNSKNIDLYKLLLNIANKINTKKHDKYVALPNLRDYYAWKNI